MRRDFTVIVEGLTFLEGSRWHGNALWFSDFFTQSVWRVVPGQSPQKMLDVPEQPSGLGWLPDGRLLVVSMRDRKVLRQEPDGQLVVHADLWSHCPWHCNDMVVATNGNAYVGNFGFDLVEPAPHRWISLVLVRPDGMTLDAQGAVWFADAASRKVVRVAAGGQVLEEIPTAPEGAFAVTLGGEDGKTLFICVAPDSHEPARKVAREGRILATRVDVGHAGSP